MVTDVNSDQLIEELSEAQANPINCKKRMANQ